VPYMISAPVQADRTADSVAELNRLVTEFLTTKGTTKEERDRVVARSINELPGDFETSGAVLGALMNIDMLGRPDNYYETLPAVYRAQTAQSLDQAARSALDFSAFSCAIRASIAASSRADIFSRFFVRAMFSASIRSEFTRPLLSASVNKILQQFSVTCLISSVWADHISQHSRSCGLPHYLATGQNNLICRRRRNGVARVFAVLSRYGGRGRRKEAIGNHVRSAAHARGRLGGGTLWWFRSSKAGIASKRPFRGMRPRSGLGTAGRRASLNDHQRNDAQQRSRYQIIGRRKGITRDSNEPSSHKRGKATKDGDRDAVAEGYSYSSRLNRELFRQQRREDSAISGLHEVKKAYGKHGRRQRG